MTFIKRGVEKVQKLIYFDKYKVYPTSFLYQKISVKIYLINLYNQWHIIKVVSFKNKFKFYLDLNESQSSEEHSIWMFFE